MADAVIEWSINHSPEIRIGTGSVCMGWKGGIGTSSRVLPPKRGGYTVGVLAQTNFDGVLTVNGAGPDGSAMVIVATDAPLDQRQLERLAKRAGLGLARTGFCSSNGSGDFCTAFSTAGRIRHDSPLTAKAEVVSNDAMSPLFLAVVAATEEAVINSILKATTVVGRDGKMVDAIDIDQLLEVMRKYNTLNWRRTLPPWGRR